MKQKDKEIQYICSECGKEYGRVQGMVTWHVAKCDKCGRKRGVCHVDDYKKNNPNWD